MVFDSFEIFCIIKQFYLFDMQVLAKVEDHCFYLLEVLDFTEESKKEESSFANKISLSETVVYYYNNNCPPMKLLKKQKISQPKSYKRQLTTLTRVESLDKEVKV